jgi:hypothetical protein
MRRKDKIAMRPDLAPIPDANPHFFKRLVSEVPCVVDVENTFDGVYAHVDLKANVPVGPGDTVRVLGDKIIAPYGSKFTLFRTAEIQRAGRLERAWTKLTGQLECLELLEVSFSAGDA